MLEHVALNQTRFNIPGVAPDSRGVLMGKQGALLFASVDRLVGFFRIFCDESSMDDLLPTLKLHQVRTLLGSREFLVIFHATSSYLLDRSARIAQLLGGLTFTGSGKHYVQYRDSASPLGYDTDALYTEPADFALYAESFSQGYRRVKDVPFAQLIFRLSPRRLPGPDRAERSLLWLTVERGLQASVVTYLWRNRVRVEATVVEPEGGRSSFGRRRSFLLARVHDLPERMLALFEQVPGITAYRQVGENCVVEAGYRHPLRLESCASVFDKNRFYVFSGSQEWVEVLATPPSLVPGQDLVGVGFDLGERREPVAMRPQPPGKLEVRLRLVPSTTASRRVTATLVSWQQAEWLKRLVYTLPPTLLASYSVASIDEGLVVRSDQGVDDLPIGDMFQEAAPSIYVPVGFEFLPRVGGEVLTEHLGGVSGRYLLFLRGAERPLSLDHSLFQPLGRRALAELDVEPRPRDERLPVGRERAQATVVNDEVGLFPLWGFRGKGSKS